MRRTAIIALILYLAGFNLVAQDSYTLINNYIERISESTTNNLSTSSIELLVENLEELYRQPININTANKEELEKLTILTEFQILSFLDYRKKVWEIATLNELNYLYGFTPETVALISPFITIKPNDSAPVSSPRFTPVSSELIARMKRNNSNQPNFLGDKQYYYLRYKAYVGSNLSLGILAESDAGEYLSINDKQNGFDHYTGFIEYKGRRVIKQLILGDYRVRIGQGLLMWPGYSSGKSSDISSINKRGQGAKGNSSSDEYGYLRGGVVKLNHNSISLSCFVSQKKLDATIDSSRQAVESIRTNGLHRTENELNHTNQLRETLLGASIEYKGEHLTGGLNFINGTYDLPILPGTYIYTQNRFTGKEYQGVSAHYKALYQRWQLFGEISNMNTQYAYLSGVNFMPDSRFLINLTYRSYDKAYYSPYAAPFSESSSYAGEEGLYMGINWQTDWKMKISAYTDLFSYSWPRYQVNNLMHGYEYLIEGIYQAAPDLTITLRYKAQQKSKNYSHDSPSFSTANHQLHAGRLTLNYALSSKLRMNTRVEINSSQISEDEKTKGKMMYQDIIYYPVEKLRLTIRYAWFDAPEYDNRIYAYEHNARFVYSLPAYYGQGTKMYLLGQYNTTQWLSIWARYSVTNYFSGISQQKNEGLIQFMLKF